MEVLIRRTWNDYREGSVDYDQITNLHWSRISGGVQALTPQPFIFGYLWCDDVEGAIAHSCWHGSAPYNIKIVIVKKNNTKQAWKKLIDVVGPKPKI